MFLKPLYRLSLMSLLMTPFVHAEVINISQHGFIIENKVTTEATPQQAWRALIDNVGQWWPADHTWWGKSENLSIDEQAGGCFCEESGNNSAEHMRISFVDQYNLLRMTGGLGPLQGMGMHGALDWSFEETEQGQTQITLKYTVSGLNPGGYDTLAPIVDKVQAQQLGGLQRFLQPTEKD